MHILSKLAESINGHVPTYIMLLITDIQIHLYVLSISIGIYLYIWMVQSSYIEKVDMLIILLNSTFHRFM
jgi:hypothetical protein